MVVVYDVVRDAEDRDRKQILYNSPTFHAWIHGPDKPGELHAMHNHTADELFHCVQGEATYHLSEGKSVKLSPGMSIVIPAGDYYQIESTGTEDLILTGARAETGHLPRFSPEGSVVAGGTVIRPAFS